MAGGQLLLRTISSCMRKCCSGCARRVFLSPLPPLSAKLLRLLYLSGYELDDRTQSTNHNDGYECCSFRQFHNRSIEIEQKTAAGGSICSRQGLQQWSVRFVVGNEYAFAELLRLPRPPVRSRSAIAAILCTAPLQAVETRLFRPPPNHRYGAIISAMAAISYPAGPPRALRRRPRAFRARDSSCWYLRPDGRSGM